MRQGGNFVGLAVVILLAFSPSGAIGQVVIPNGGFEVWVTDQDSNFNPVGWETTNSYPMVNVDRFSPGCQGNYAMRVRTINTGIITLPGIAFLYTPLPFGSLPTQLTVSFRDTLVGGDVALVIVGLLRGDSVVASTGDCTYRIDTSHSQCTIRHFPIVYHSSLVPDSLVLIIASGLSGGHVGTELIVDDISFTGGGATGVAESAPVPKAFGLRQNFPNPFNPTTTIRYHVSAAGPVTLKVFDLLGREISTLVNEVKSPGEHSATWDGSNAASGVYVYRLQSGQSVEAKKLVLLR